MLDNRNALYPECSSVEEDTKILNEFLEFFDNSFTVLDTSSPETLEKSLDNFLPIMEAADRIQTYCTLKKIFKDDADDENLIKLLDEVNFNFHKLEDTLLEVNDLKDWGDKPILMKHAPYFGRVLLRANRSGYYPTVARLLEAKKDVINDLNDSKDSLSDLVSLYLSSISVDEALANEMSFSSSYEAVTHRDRFSDFCIDTSLLNYPLAFLNMDVERILNKNKFSLPLDEVLNIMKKILSDIHPSLIDYFNKVIDPDYMKINNTQELGYKSKNFSIDTYTFRPLTFVNYDGSFSSIGDLAHEIGHGIFTLCQKDYNDILSFSKSPLEAETAAIIFEIKIFDYLEDYIYDYYFDEDTLRSLKASKLKFIRDNFYYNLALVDFERKCHTEYRDTHYINEKRMQSYCMGSFYKYLNRRDISLKNVLSDLEIYKPFYALNYALGFLFAFRMKDHNMNVFNFLKKGFFGIPLFKQEVSYNLDEIIETLEDTIKSSLEPFIVEF